NPNLRAVYTDVRFGCSAPRPDGEGNIDDDPQLLALLNPHLAEASPCRGAGTTNGVEEGETDIDDEPRVVSGQTDVGCDQYTGGQIAGALTVDILAPYDALLTGVPLAMSADVIGKAYWQRWLIQTNSGARMVSNAVQVTQAWPVAGVYTVLLEAANATLTNADTLVVYVSESAEHYASPDGANEYPYTNWKTAANSLLDAVETCPAGGILYVGTGVYFEADTVRVTKPLSILGVGPAEEIQVDGQGAIPCFYLNHASAVLSNLTLVNGWSPDQGGGAYVRDGLVTHCHVISNYAFEQGGGLMAWGDARVEWCTIAGNEAGQWGGGIMANERAVIRNCFLQDNAAHNYGGGADISDGVRLQNCFITGNRAFGGGGVHLDGGGIAQNCTILKNEATDSGGGILHRFADTGATYNCIVYHNESPVGPNIAFQVSTTGTVEHTCSSPLFGGAGNITNEPALLGLDNPHIVASSPCIGAGSTNYIEGIEEDIDGEARVFGGAVDMGCDEFIGTNILGALTAAIRGETQVVAGEAAELFADIRGKAWGYVWNVAESGATNVIPDTFEIAPAWAAAGWYDVILAASNLETTAAATVSVHVIEGGFTNYVSPDGGHVAPFTNWTDAATNVQAAIDACWVGGVVMVGTGTYAEGRTIELNKPVAVVGAGAPEDCVFDGEMAYRVINLDDPRALLANIGVTGGWDEDAAGVAMLEGTVSNCVIAGNINAVVGGGIRCAGHSLLTDSLVTGNISQNWPGGVFCSGYGVVRNCLIEGNLAQVHGGGVYLDQGGVVTGCVIEANSAMSGGGAYLHYAGSVTHSTIHSNDSANGAGAFLYWGGVVTNCDITWNWGEMDGGGLWFNGGGLVTDSRVQRNFADEGAGSGGGAVLSQGGVLRRCDVSTNTASAGAGIYSQYGGLIDRCHIHHNVAPEGWGQASGGGVKLYQGDEIRNGLIEHNSSSNVAGGLLMLVGGTARNCTIANNTAGGEAGGMAVGSAGTLYNCIVYANTAPDAPNWDVDPGAVVDHCCTTPDFPAFVGTIAADPAFEGGGSYRLRTNSPCVNAGVNDYWMNGATDLDGSARIQNVAVDVGAYESAWWGLFTDVDEDDFNDWVEVNVTGTDPADETSFLGMRDFGVQGPGAEGIVVRWQSVAGKLYHVDRATNLVESPKFTNWMTGVVGLPGATEVTDTTATAGAPWFYRVGIEP
ncbi:MAG TPA: right-handed parallel beta-helix repeat-containing protein, partial [Kiritimatiellia bacterium]|nr:right-handed parallel beta-helix repeat-containing protein [Kiritimatiellia bacterium]